jgi:hypothetical protein
MTAKAWCAISKAVEMIKTAQNTSVGRAQAWLIEVCVAGNIRSREPWRDPILLLPDDGILGMEFEPGQLGVPAASVTVSRKRAPLPVMPAAWKGAVIDKDVLVDVDHVRMRGIEISLADLEFELKRSVPTSDSKPASPPPISRSGGRPSDKEPILAEAQRRLAVGENIPSSLSAFARDLHHWLNKQPWAYRGIKNRKVLAASSIEEHIRPLWRKYRPE